MLILPPNPDLRIPPVRIVTPRLEDRRAYAFVEFEQVRSAVAAIEEMQFRVSDAALVI